tara:strand:- start:3291 stop:4265 length:975 start_codon:yes stop_codon:yes gene_type:complete
MKYIILIVLLFIITIQIIYIDKYSYFPIDVVYTWTGEINNNNKRFSYNNELKYSLRSIIKFAPWVNHIYIYMNPPKKIPSWFNNNYKKKITILDHTETVLRNYMPNTNSNAIETTLSEIPGLSENFIYFNDDVFLTRPCKWRDFFSISGKPYIPEECSTAISMIKDKNKTKTNIIYPDFPNKQFKNGWIHIPIPRLKSSMKQFQKEYSDYIKWVRNTKTRKNIGCNVCINLHCPCQQQHSLISYYMYKNGNAVLKKYNKLNIHKYTTIKKLATNKEYLKSILNYSPKFLCVNDADDDIQKHTYSHIIKNEFYEKLYHEKPFYEK